MPTAVLANLPQRLGHIGGRLQRGIAQLSLQLHACVASGRDVRERTGEALSRYIWHTYGLRADTPTRPQPHYGWVPASRHAASADCGSPPTFVPLRRGHAADHLRNALSSRSVIDQAIGIVMAQRRCDPQPDFAALRMIFQRCNINSTLSPPNW